MKINRNTLQKILITIILSTTFTSIFSQFQGEIKYELLYLDNYTQQPMFDAKPETVYMKNGKYKLVMDSSSDGALEWQIFDYSNDVSYLKYSEHSNSTPIYDSSQLKVVNGKLILGKPLNDYKAPIQRSILCKKLRDTSNNIVLIDSLYDVNGFKSKLAIYMSNNVPLVYYYYSDSIKISPEQYQCSRLDGLDKLYKLTNGALITATVTKLDIYILYERIKSIANKEISNDIFSLPVDLKIIDAQR